MKTYIYILIFGVVAMFTSCGEKSGADGIGTDLIDPKNPPVISFEDTTYNFGTISQGEVIKYTFYFTNTGKSNLIIQDVRPSCGCTIPKNWPRTPVKPGAEGKIEVSFDSAGKQGKVTKTIGVMANTKPTVKVLRLTGEIKAPDSGGK